LDGIKRGAAIEPAEGKLGVLLVGLGAVSTTLLAGVFLARRGLGRPVGSLTQMGKLRLGKRTDNRVLSISELVPLASLGDLEFAAWDIFSDSAATAARKARVLQPGDIDAVGEELEALGPWSAVFDHRYVKRLDGPHLKRGTDKMDLARQLMDDIETFRRSSGVSRMVMVWAASTEAYTCLTDVHQTLEAFEKGLAADDPHIAPSQVYAYAALKSGIPYVNGAPHPTLECPALQELAQARQVPYGGKDFKTGQTLMKTIVAPGLQSRLLGIRGWFSTNILGNRDGEVLDDPESFRSKEVSKLGVLDTILHPEIHPELYGDLYHKVRINYYPPRGDNKESWDNIDLFGWLDYPMEIKINFLCRDSILAAPVMLDLILFMDLAQRAGMHGIQEWLSFYFKSPMVKEGLYPENDLFIQRSKLENTLRYLAREDLIHHTGLDYYYDLEDV
jgi:myo-inositol-1-phosphate synthase